MFLLSLKPLRPPDGSSFGFDLFPQIPRFGTGTFFRWHISYREAPRSGTRSRRLTARNALSSSEVSVTAGAFCPALRRSRAGRLARIPGANDISPASRVDMPIACTRFSRRRLRRSRGRSRSEGRTTRRRGRTSHERALQRCGVVICEPRHSGAPSGPSGLARERRVPGGGGISELLTRRWRIGVWNAATRPGARNLVPSRSTRLDYADWC